jgi:hypothetical protein
MKNTVKRQTQFPLLASVALAALMSQAWAAPVHAGIAVSLGQNLTSSTYAVDSQAWYPNPDGAAGPNHFVEFIAGRFAAYSKAEGSPVQSMTDSAFWNQAGVGIPSGGSWVLTYPRLVYDPSVQRWFASEVYRDDSHPTNTYHFLLAVSATVDPTGVWTGESIPGDPGGLNAGATMSMGLDAKGVYLSSLVWSMSAPVGSTLLSFPKTDLLAAIPTFTNSTWFGYRGASTQGYGLQPAICVDGTAGGDVLATGGWGWDYANNINETNHSLVGFAVQGAGGPGQATLSNVKMLAVPPYTAPPNASQPDGSSNLIDGDAAFTAAVYRVGGVLFATHMVQLNNHAAIRWYRVDATNDALLESGTVADPNLDLFFPSIAANTEGTIVIDCSGSGTNSYVNCYATVGQTENAVTKFGKLLMLQAGAASYQNLAPNGGNYWGMYSTTCTDPTDPTIFWTINMFASGPSTWSTQITQLLTSPSPQLSIANTGPNLLLSRPRTSVPFQLQSTPSLTGTNSWSGVTAATATNGNTVSVLVPARGAASFFRLLQTQ